MTHFQLSRNWLTMLTCCAGLAALTGCVSSSAIHQIGNNSYTLTSSVIGFESSITARDSVYKQAQEKCEAENKKFVLLGEVNDTPSLTFGLTTDNALSFRCLSADDPQYKETPRIKNDPGPVLNIYYAQHEFLDNIITPKQ